MTEISHGMANFTKEQMEELSALLAPQSATRNYLSEAVSTIDQAIMADLKSVNDRINILRLISKSGARPSR